MKTEEIKRLADAIRRSASRLGDGTLIEAACALVESLAQPEEPKQPPQAPTTTPHGNFTLVKWTPLTIPWPRSPSGAFRAIARGQITVGDLLLFDDDGRAARAPLVTAHAIATENAKDGDEVAYVPLPLV